MCRRRRGGRSRRTEKRTVFQHEKHNARFRSFVCLLLRQMEWFESPIHDFIVQLHLIIIERRRFSAQIISMEDNFERECHCARCMRFAAPFSSRAFRLTSNTLSNVNQTLFLRLGCRPCAAARPSVARRAAYTAARAIRAFHSAISLINGISVRIAEQLRPRCDLVTAAAAHRRMCFPERRAAMRVIKLIV